MEGTCREDAQRCCGNTPLILAKSRQPIMCLIWLAIKGIKYGQVFGGSRTLTPTSRELRLALRGNKERKATGFSTYPPPRTASEATTWCHTSEDIGSMSPLEELSAGTWYALTPWTGACQVGDGSGNSPDAAYTIFGRKWRAEKTSSRFLRFRKFILVVTTPLKADKCMICIRVHDCNTARELVRTSFLEHV